MLSVQQFLAKNSLTPVSHLPDSPDLTPSNRFFLFPQMKKLLKGKCFAIVNEVKQTNNKGRSTERHQNRQVQKLFGAVEKSLDRGIASNESPLKVTEV